MKFYRILVIAIIFGIYGCAAPQVKMSEGANLVKIGKSDPADNYSEIGPITATDGKGCGAYGYRGTYDRAIINLKNKASQLNADYVQIFSLIEPHLRGGCFDNVYKINGTAFKKTSESPSPIPIADKSKSNGIEKLRELKLLLDEGIISQQEFDEQKGRILKNGL